MESRRCRPRLPGGQHTQGVLHHQQQQDTHSQLEHQPHQVLHLLHHHHLLQRQQHQQPGGLQHQWEDIRVSTQSSFPQLSVWQFKTRRNISQLLVNWSTWQRDLFLPRCCLDWSSQTRAEVLQIILFLMFNICDYSSANTRVDHRNRGGKWVWVGKW